VLSYCDWAVEFRGPKELTLMYGSETVIVQQKDKSKIQAMDMKFLSSIIVTIAKLQMRKSDRNKELTDD
jgi:hypothetical protein